MAAAAWEENPWAEGCMAGWKPRREGRERGEPQGGRCLSAAGEGEKEGEREGEGEGEREGEGEGGGRSGVSERESGLAAGEEESMEGEGWKERSLRRERAKRETFLGERSRAAEGGWGWGCRGEAARG